MRIPRRRCTKCGEWKRPSDFYAAKRGRDGLMSYCKECIKANTRADYWKDVEASRAADRERSLKPARRKQLQASLRRQRATDPEKFNATSRRWAEANPEKRKAHVAVGNALRDGKLKKGPCEGCGRKPSKAVHAHHADYSKSLEVRWLCTRCHGLEHRAENEKKRGKEGAAANG